LESDDAEEDNGDEERTKRFPKPKFHAMKGPFRGKTLDLGSNEKMHKSFLKHRSCNAVTKVDASDDESSDEDDEGKDDRRVVTLLLLASVMKKLGKYLITLTPKEKNPPAICTALNKICKDCDRVPELEMEIKELKTNLNIVKLS
jgi:hypothetical protein